MIIENDNNVNKKEENNNQMEIIVDDEIPAFPETIEVIDFDDDEYY